MLLHRSYPHGTLLAVISIEQIVHCTCIIMYYLLSLCLCESKNVFITLFAESVVLWFGFLVHSV